MTITKDGDVNIWKSITAPLFNVGKINADTLVANAATINGGVNAGYIYADSLHVRTLHVGNNSLTMNDANPTGSGGAVIRPYTAQLHNASSNGLVLEGAGQGSTAVLRDNIKYGIGVFPLAAGPQGRLHLHDNRNAGTSGNFVFQMFSNFNTGSAATDGFKVGVTGGVPADAGHAFLDQRETGKHILLNLTAGATGGNVGIDGQYNANNLPKRKLDVFDNGTGTTGGRPQFRLTQTADPNAALGIFTDFQTTDDGDLYIKPTTNGIAGNVAIGPVFDNNINLPTHRLDIDGQARIRTINTLANPPRMLVADALGVVQSLNFGGATDVLHGDGSWSPDNEGEVLTLTVNDLGGNQKNVVLTQTSGNVVTSPAFIDIDNFVDGFTVEEAANFDKTINLTQTNGQNFSITFPDRTGAAGAVNADNGLFVVTAGGSGHTAALPHIELGGGVGTGNGALHSSRELPMNGFNMNWINGTSTSGKFGIGVKANLDAAAYSSVKFHVASDESSVLQAITTAVNTNGTQLNLGAGTRMHWYPRRAAFRAGQVTGTNWDDAQIGNHSFAAGNNPRASGNNSAAFGSSLTYGEFSFATGASIAGDVNNINSGSPNFIGRGAVAMGENAQAVPLALPLLGADSRGARAAVALGNATANGNNSFACGTSVARGFSSVAMGASNVFLDGLGTSRWAVAIGQSSATGEGAVALGGSTANGYYALAMGTNAQALASQSIAIGNSATIGVGNDNAIAIGTETSADAAGSVVIGNFSQTLGGNSVAIGRSLTTTANNAVVIGQGIDAIKFNNATASSLLVGFANAFTVPQVPQPHSLFVQQATLASPNGRVGIGTTAPGDFLLNVNGRAGNPGGLWENTSSDRSLKTDITPYADGLNILRKINTINYRYNGLAGYPTDQKHIGIIANDILPVAPYMVDSMDIVLHPELFDTTKILTFKSSMLTYTSINAIKQLDSANTAKDSIIDKLNERLTTMESIVGACCSQTANKKENDNTSSLQEKTISEKNIRKKQIELHIEDKIYLAQNKPNPHNGKTTVDYYLPANITNAILKFYDSLGREIKQVVLETGYGSIEINMQNLPNGAYPYSIIINDKVV